MKKNEIIKIWKDLLIDQNIIQKIIINITGLSKSQLFLEDNIVDKYIKEIINAYKQVNKKIPIEYIINQAEFYWLNFFVNKNVLIPRNDTEIMVDKALEEIIKNKSNTLIDIWTWSWCIPISILKNTNKIDRCIVVDKSKLALKVCNTNITRHNLDTKIEAFHWNLLAPIFKFNNFKIYKNIIITANLPYIKNNDYQNMDYQTIKFEPKQALYWWKDTWFELYEKLIKQCIKLKKIIWKNFLSLFIEIWFDQKEVSKKFLISQKLDFYIYKDNSWIDRCIKIFFN